MIEYIRVNGFKSLAEFEFYPGKFNCLVGLNGAGKSTVLQAMDFIASLHQGTVREWLSSRKWDFSDLAFKGSRKIMIFQVTFRLDSGTLLCWTANFNRIKMACTHEIISEIGEGRKIFEFQNGKYRTEEEDEWKTIDFNFEGSILSQLRDNALSEKIIDLRNYVSKMRSMDLLSPHLIRQRSRKLDVQDIGVGGERLSVFLHGLTSKQKAELAFSLRKYNPNLVAIHTRSVKGWITIELEEKFSDGLTIKTESRHLNDGFMRILAIYAQRYSDCTFVLYDEIENGVNPEVAKALLDSLLELPKQVLVTTHSPVILNFIPEELARRSVYLIYKNGQAETHASRLFEIPAISEKLDFLAPGEALIDLPHAALAEEAAKISAKKKEKEKNEENK